MPASSSPIACPALFAATCAAFVSCASEPPTTAAAAARQQHALAVARAAEYCRKRGLVMRASPADAPTRPGHAASDFQFRCVKAH